MPLLLIEFRRAHDSMNPLVHLRFGLLLVTELAEKRKDLFNKSDLEAWKYLAKLSPYIRTGKDVSIDKWLTKLRNSGAHVQMSIRPSECGALIAKLANASYGSYDFVGVSRSWYKNEIRIVRNDKSIRST